VWCELQDSLSASLDTLGVLETYISSSRVGEAIKLLCLVLIGFVVVKSVKSRGNAYMASLTGTKFSDKLTLSPILPAYAILVRSLLRLVLSSIQSAGVCRLGCIVVRT
jgi:uncharacterized membrane protein YjgN (DUF898 family)